MEDINGPARNPHIQAWIDEHGLTHEEAGVFSDFLSNATHNLLSFWIENWIRHSVEYGFYKFLLTKEYKKMTEALQNQGGDHNGKNL